MSVYRVWREEEGVRACVVSDDGTSKPLPHIPIHSPTGYEMGYGGSGPADLALAILAHHLHAPTEPIVYRVAENELARRAWSLHQDFKRDFVALHTRGFEVSSREIDDWIERREESE